MLNWGSKPTSNLMRISLRFLAGLMSGMAVTLRLQEPRIQDRIREAQRDAARSTSHRMTKATATAVQEAPRDERPSS